VNTSVLFTEDEVRPDAKLLYHGSSTSLYGVLLPAGSKNDSYKLCVTIEGVDAFHAKCPVTISLRVGFLCHRPTRSLFEISKLILVIVI